MNTGPDCSTCMYVFKEAYEYPCKRCQSASHWKLNPGIHVESNGDRLRSLPDEELAKAIARKISGCYGCPATNELECAECVLEWLRKEANE